ncbi:retrotransposon hot spot (RHS) protein, putative, partial [Trypanosoma cruzi]
MQASDRYLRMERAVRDEMNMEEDADELYEKGVDKLLKWLVNAAEVKATVHEITKRFLDAAAEEARNPTTTSAPEKLEGCYNSVYNARWSHVVEVSDGEGTGMEAKEGEPQQTWDYKKVDDTLKKDDGVEQSGAPRPRLLVLTSDKAWPYSWAGSEHICDCYVDCEVDRVWQIVKGDLTKWFSSHGKAVFSPKKRLVIGTPGIGKSMNAGSYLFYRLLQYDVEKLPMVAYIIKNSVYLFDNTKKTVSDCGSEEVFVDLLKDFTLRGVKGYIIYD